VRDSILRTYLMEMYPEDYGIEPDYDLNPNAEVRIDWRKSIRWDDQEVREILEEEMYLPQHERLNGRKEFDTRKYRYKYQVLDIMLLLLKAKEKVMLLVKGIEVNFYLLSICIFFLIL
jgi:hypothetical protein